MKDYFTINKKLNKIIRTNKKKKKKIVWLKISDGLYENQTKLRKRKKK